MFEDNNVIIHTSCQDFYREINSYKYKPNSDEIIKLNDHAMDEMRYFLYSRRPEATQQSTAPFAVAVSRPDDIYGDWHPYSSNSTRTITPWPKW
jgi:hypothetical protein